MYAVGESTDETFKFYQALIKEHEDYVVLKQKTQYCLEQGLPPHSIGIADYVLSVNYDMAVGKKWTSK